jgi:hypothetical protein
MKTYIFSLIGTDKTYSVKSSSIEIAYDLVKQHLGTNKIVLA